MKEDFVSYDIAVKLKEKGFKYNKMNLIDKICMENQINNPTIFQVLKWLREEKNLHIEIVSSSYGYIYIVSDTPDRGGTDRVNIPYKGKNDGGAWDDYNECVLDAIEYVIDNLI